MFLLRCVFWLSIVYAAIFWSHGTLVWDTKSGHAAETGRLGVESLVRSAASGARDVCASHAAACLADAARLTSLFAATDPKPTPTAIAAPPPGGRPGLDREVPLPVPDPRRMRDAKLTRNP